MKLTYPLPAKNMPLPQPENPASHKSGWQETSYCWLKKNKGEGGTGGRKQKIIRGYTYIYKHGMKNNI